ncbi:hypothetical protein ABGB14_27505 [Nonomuraea sp. B10E15]|uniref:hypothetical protein n=1 Tax=Nonomuraea sp. B10E15 TaxID=3153560 RepID=UPI00325C80B8
MAERSVEVRDPSVRPTEVCIAAKREQILAWLENTSPVEVHDRGMTYGKVAETIRSVADALPDVGTALNGAWRSGSAAKTQQALRKLQASGSRLATAMQDMSEALTLYGRDYLPQAIEEARKDASGDQGEDGPARLALEKLNRRIISLYENKLPQTVSVDLPEVSPTGDTGGTRRMPLETQASYRQGDYWNGGSGSSGGSTGSSPFGGTGSHSGTGTPGSGPGSDNGSDSGRDTGSDGGTGDDPAAESPASPGDQTGSTGDQNGQSPTEQNPGDGTAPAVIDNNATDTPGDTRDPGSTESANAPVQNPPTAHTPVTQQPVGSQPPGTPAVIGGGGSYTQAGTPGAVSARPGVGGMGMPFLPMGGMASGEQSQDQERSTYLTEDRDMWHPGERSTSPVIGA